MIKIEVNDDNAKVKTEGNKEDAITETCMAICLAIRVLKDLKRDKEFCRSACEIALDYYFK